MLKRIISWIRPEVCFRCSKCVSGCPVAEIVDDYRPNRIVRMAYFGYIDELLESEIIWYCTQCFTCTERCPMEVAPADIIVALRNIASRRKKPHDAWVRMGQNIMREGKILPEMGIVTKERKLVKRKDLGITVYKPRDINILRGIFKKTGNPLASGE